MSVLPEAIANREQTTSSAIHAGATNLTIGSGIVAFLAILGTVINPVFKEVFPKGASDGVKATIIVAVIAAWAVVALGDLFARAITKAASEHGQWVVAPVKDGVTATVTTGTDTPGWIVAATRFPLSDTSAVEYLVVKAGSSPQWVAAKDLDIA
jgi:hypothetical protein